MSEIADRLSGAPQYKWVLFGHCTPDQRWEYVRTLEVEVIPRTIAVAASNDADFHVACARVDFALQFRHPLDLTGWNFRDAAHVIAPRVLLGQDVFGRGIDGRIAEHAISLHTSLARRLQHLRIHEQIIGKGRDRLQRGLLQSAGECGGMENEIHPGDGAAARFHGTQVAVHCGYVVAKRVRSLVNGETDTSAALHEFLHEVGTDHSRAAGY